MFYKISLNKRSSKLFFNHFSPTKATKSLRHSGLLSVKLYKKKKNLIEEPEISIYIYDGLVVESATDANSAGFRT